MPTVPLKLVLGLAIALVAITTGVIGFVPTYLEGVDAATEVVSLVRRTAVNLASVRTISFFTYPLRTLQALEISVNNSIYNLMDPPRNITVSDYGQVICDLIQRDPNKVTRTVAFYSPSVEYFSFCDAEEVSPGVRNYLVNYDRFRSTYDIYISMDNKLILAAPVLSLPGNYADLLTYSGYVQTVALPNTYRWSRDLINGIGTLNMVLGFKAPDMSGRNARDVVIHMDISTNSLQTFLRELNLGSGYRAMIIHRHSQLMLATSWHEPAVDVVNNGWVGLSLDIKMTNKTLDSFSDPTVRSFVQHFGGGKAFFNVPLPYSGTIGRTDDRLFIDAVPITDNFGLDLVLVLLLKERDYLEGIYASRSIVIGAVAGAVALMAILGVAFAFAVVRPIERVAKRMELTAQLQDEDDADESSGLTEVRTMQHSYGKMKEQLSIMKKFLPPSVLNELVMGANTTDTEDTDEELKRKAAQEREEGIYAESEMDEGALIQSANEQNVDPSGMSMAGQSVHSYTIDRENMTHSMTYDRSTTLSQSSRRRERVVRTLNMAASLTNKRISVVSFNVSGWHDYVRRKNSEGNTVSYAILLTKYIEGVNRRVKENKGVIDMFQGDHVFASFNAVNVLATHARRSVTCAFDVQRDFSIAAFGLERLHITAGVSVGTAIVGNAGTNEMMKFTITGQCYSEASALERFARTFRAGCPRPKPEMQDFAPTPDAAISYLTPYTLTPVIVSGSIMQETENDFLYQIVDIIELPRVSEGKRRRGVVASVERSARNGGNADEWMYTLQTMTAANPFSTVNNAFRSILRGDLTPEQILHTMEGEVADRGTVSLHSSVSVGVPAPGGSPTTHFHVPATISTPARSPTKGANISPHHKQVDSPALGNSLGIRVLPIGPFDAEAVNNTSTTSWGLPGKQVFDAAGQAQVRYVLAQIHTEEDMQLYARILK